MNLFHKTKRNLPNIGEEVLANIDGVGFRMVYLANDPNERAACMILFRRDPVWFCKKEKCFYELDRVIVWYKVNQINKKDPQKIGYVTC